MRKNLLLTTALVALVATNANAAQERLDVRGSDTTIATGTIFSGLESKVGGAIYVNKGAVLDVIDGVEFNGNKAAFGGAINATYDNGTINKIINSKFIGNEAKPNDGGWRSQAGAIRSNGTIGEINNTEFSNNIAGNGGAINNGSNGKMKIVNSTFSGNKAQEGPESVSGGQGGAVVNAADLTVAGSTFTKNEAVGNGGAIVNTERRSGSLVANLNVSGSTFDGNKAGIAGGAVYNETKSVLNIADSTFKNNTITDLDGWGGALDNEGTANIVGSTFDGNYLLAGENGFGGAIFNNDTMTIDKSTFLNNKADIELGEGGAIYHNSGDLKISNSNFEGNEAWDGGAISQSVEEGDTVTMTVTGSNFKNNTAGDVGGALSIWAKADISNSTFEGNKATGNDGMDEGLGGAVYVTKDNSVNLSGNTYRNNSAVQGGALFNDNGNMKLSGNSVFEGNKDANGLNDIHNNGNIEVSGNLTLDGGITGENGTINFAEGTNLTVKQGVTTIAGNTLTQVANATLNLVIANGGASSEPYKLVDDSALDGNFKLAQNNLYNIVESETQKGTYEIAKKSANEVAQSTGASASQAQAIDAVTQGTSSNGTFNNIANSINDNLQSSNKADVQAALTALDTMGADEAPIVQQTQVENTAQIISAVSSRLSSGAIASAKQGAASGDSWLEKGAMWVQSLFNKSKLDDHGSVKGFDADTNGIAFGFEKKINNDVKVGVAYAYNNTDVDGFMRDTEIDAHSAILYSEYKPAEWFVNTVISYTWGEYDEDKYVLGNTLSADYDVNSIAWQAMTGYEFALNNTVITPQAGLRYIHYEQDSYKDSADTYVSGDNADLLTAFVGAKISTDYQLDNGMMLVPEARLAMTYDLNTDSANASVRLANGGAYSVKGDRLDRVAVEFGAGVKAEVNDNVELSVAYEGSYRDNYEDHTGLLNLKYNF